MARIGFKPGTKTLSPDSEIVKGGLYAPTTLSAVDADLATANIKNGITIFGKVGSADVRDISDADALVGEVKTGSTFYAVSGARKTGTGTKTLSDANDTVAAGYYAATTLSAVDAQLAAANIKDGVNIFGFTGPATVQEIGAADAVLADVKAGKTFFSVTGGIKTGNLATVAITDVNDDYPAGYHVGNVGGLVAIDAQLVTGSIKSGVTIFGVAGHNDVRDISDADLVEAEAPTGKFFYAVSGGRRTGSGTKTLNPANEVVAAGYYAATTLSAVDAQLAAANIKDGVNIFGFTGPATVQEIGAADAVLADVKAGKTFFSVTGGIKTGNLATVALNAAANAYPAGYHVGAASLTAVDGDLAAGNIKDGVTIFGVLGTYVQALAEDVEGYTKSVVAINQYSGTFWRNSHDIAALGELSLALKTLVFDASSLAFAAGFGNLCGAIEIKLRLYMGGVQMQETGAISAFSLSRNYVLHDFKALSGSEDCELKAYNSDTVNIRALAFIDGSLSEEAAAIAVGSVKLA